MTLGVGARHAAPPSVMGTEMGPPLPTGRRASPRHKVSAGPMGGAGDARAGGGRGRDTSLAPINTAAKGAAKANATISREQHTRGTSSAAMSTVAAIKAASLTGTTAGGTATGGD